MVLANDVNYVFSDKLAPKTEILEKIKLYLL